MHEGETNGRLGFALDLFGVFRNFSTFQICHRWSRSRDRRPWKWNNWWDQGRPLRKMLKLWPSVVFLPLIHTHRALTATYVYPSVCSLSMLLFMFQVFFNTFLTCWLRLKAGVCASVYLRADLFNNSGMTGSLLQRAVLWLNVMLQQRRDRQDNQWATLLQPGRDTSYRGAYLSHSSLYSHL